MKAFRLGIVCAAACLMASVVFGQRMFGGGSRDLGVAQMAKIFGKTKAFSATAEVAIVDKQHGQPVTMETQYAFLNGNIRTDLDMSSMKGTAIPPQAVAQMKAMGMDHTANVFRGDKKLMYMIYPGLKSYCIIDTTMVPGADKPSDKEPKVEVTALGKETVDGHPCVKNKITITSDDGKAQDILAWQASDMNDFPIKTEMEAGTSTVTTHFTNINMSAPDASLFEPPTDFKKYDSIQELMMNSMGAMHGGMPPHAPTPPPSGN